MAFKQELGRRGERLAVKKLIDGGHVIVATNYRCALGELDIVSVGDGVLVVTEVKTRSASSLRFGQPREAVVRRKIGKISRMTMVFLGSNKSVLVNTASARGIRFDVIEIVVETSGKVSMTHLEDAFSL